MTNILKITTDTTIEMLCNSATEMPNEIKESLRKIGEITTVGELLGCSDEKFDKFLGDKAIDVVSFIKKCGLVRVPRQTEGLDELGGDVRFSDVREVASLQTKYFEEGSDSLAFIEYSFNQYFDRLVESRLTDKATKIINHKDSAQIKTDADAERNLVREKNALLSHYKEYEEIMCEKVAACAWQTGTEKTQTQEKKRVQELVETSVGRIKDELSGLRRKKAWNVNTTAEMLLAFEKEKRERAEKFEEDEKNRELAEKELGLNSK